MSRPLAYLVLLATLLAPGLLSAATVPGGDVCAKNAGTLLTCRPFFDFHDGLAATDDGTNIDITSLTAPPDFYVCADTGATCNTSVSNAGTSPTATLPCIQDALDKLPGLVTNTVTIHVASNTADYSCPAVATSVGVRTTSIYINKFISGGKELIIQGTMNATSHSFTDVPADSGTSTGGNLNDFPLTTGGVVGESTLNDTTKAWTVNAFIIYYLHLTGGTGYQSAAGLEYENWYVVNSNTATQLKLSGKWLNATPDATTTYQLYAYNTLPRISGSNVNTGIMITSSENVVIRRLRAGMAALDDKRSIWAWRSRFRFEVGDIGVNTHQSNSTYSVYHAVQSAYGGQLSPIADCGPIAYCVYEQTDLRNYLTTGLTAFQNAFVWLSGSTIAGHTSGGGQNIQALKGGSIQVEFSRLTAPTGGRSILVLDSGSASLLDRVYVLCNSTAAGNDGIIVSMSSAISTTGSAHRINSCNYGIRIGYQTTWHAAITPSYTGNTTNELINAAGTKSATAY